MKTARKKTTRKKTTPDKAALRRRQRPRMGSGLLADTAKKSSSDKVDCEGVFTFFRAWSYPCTRSAGAVITVFDLPAGERGVRLSVRERGKRRATRLVKGKMNVPEGSSSVCVTVPFPVKFNGQGRYEILCAISGVRATLAIPVDVITQEWPEFTKEETAFAHAHPEMPTTARTTLHCSGKDCAAVHMFEESVVPSKKMARGARRFSDTGVFKCPTCGRALRLRDVQGQLRDSLKGILREQMRKG